MNTKTFYKKIIPSQRTIIFAIIFFTLGIAVQRYVPVARGLSETEQQYDLSLFWKVWNLMESKYPFEAPTDQERLYGAIEGLVDSYNDDYTVFLPPTESKNFENTISGSFGGIGVEIEIIDGLLTVVAPLENSPAQKAGVKSGDVIVEVDKTKLDGLSFNETLQRIRGKVGTKVTLTIVRSGVDEKIDIPITRDIVKIPVTKTETIDDVFIIHLYNFNEESTQYFKDAINEFEKSGKKKLILDLRNNPGGFLSSAIDVASYFIPQGKTIVKEDFGRDDKPNVKYRSVGHKNISSKKINMIILVNKGSASASEIVAGALQEHKIATVIGETSFGKGSVQELIKLPGETSLKVTIAHWLTPNGNQITGKGVIPDIIVKQEGDDRIDEQLEKALQTLKK